MLVAHDVNPILGYLDRVIYLAHGAARGGAARPGHHQRDALGALRHPGRGAPHPRRATGGGGPTRGARPPPRPASRMIAFGQPTAELEPGLGPAPAADLPVHGQRPGWPGTIVAVVAGRHRLVHGAAAPDLRRPHPGRGRLPRRGRRRPDRGQRPVTATSASAWSPRWSSRPCPGPGTGRRARSRPSSAPPRPSPWPAASCS